MSWGGLNRALTAWRDAINARFPDRGNASDGGYADKVHGSSSQHQPDADGSVDAFDMDVNLLGSDVESGTVAELTLISAMKADFEADPRAQLWIHRHQIANRDVGSWRERYYDGVNPHTRHVHWESRQAREGDGRPWPMPRTDAVIDKLEDEQMTPERFLELLRDDQVAAQLSRLAGIGVHNQRIGRSDETIGMDLQRDETAPILARLDVVEQKVDALLSAVVPPDQG